jgi:hypothetical protein
LLWFLYWGCKTNQRVIPFGYLLRLLVQENQGPPPPGVFWSPSVSVRDDEGPGDCGSGVFTAEEVDAAEAEGSGDTTTVNVDTLGNLLPDLGLFSSAADISGFMEYQLLN